VSPKGSCVGSLSPCDNVEVLGTLRDGTERKMIRWLRDHPWKGITYLLRDHVSSHKSEFLLKKKEEEASPTPESLLLLVFQVPMCILQS
jgi:hypothetical protein